MLVSLFHSAFIFCGLLQDVHKRKEHAHLPILYQNAKKENITMEIITPIALDPRQRYIISKICWNQPVPLNVPIPHEETGKKDQSIMSPYNLDTAGKSKTT